MGVEYPIEVECLAEKEAFDLFQKKVGQRTLGSDPEIPDLARKVARKCSGLPLALNVIGETMSSKRTVQEWLNAIVVLDKYATEFRGMKDRILPLLKYSYDDLKGEHLKPCLLYCALFPEDAEIFKDHLVDYWICEGIIDGSEGIEIAEYKGYEIISNLVGASLLMEKTNSVRTLEPNSVRMHDVVREMALWIASGLGAEKEAWIVRAGVRLQKMPKVENWKAVRRMSLMNNNINYLAGMPECLELTTLLMQQNSALKEISSKFFKFMPKLVVLDLSHNRYISELPDGISELGSLQFLNLSHTYVQRLPMGLEKLIHLNLDRTPKLSSIAGISNMRNLRVLKVVDSGFSWDRGIVEELETLQHLEVANIGIARSTFLEQFLRSHRLANCTRYLQMKNITHLELSVVISLPAAMDTLRYLNVWDCEITELWIGSNPRNPCCFLSLSSVSIRNCGLLAELTFLMFAPNLKRLDVENAYQVEDIIKASEGENESVIVPFQKMSYLRLHNLPKLTSIYWRTMTFPCLKTIDVDNCPMLKNIPQVSSDQN